MPLGASGGSFYFGSAWEVFLFASEVLRFTLEVLWPLVTVLPAAFMAARHWECSEAIAGQTGKTDLKGP